MSKLWVIVADQSKARFFTVPDRRGALQEVAELDHSEARDREQTLTSDKAGRSFDSQGQGRHTMGAEVEPAKQETIRFAREITDYVQTEHNKGNCDRLVLVAGPPLLGLLRADLKSVSGLDISEIEKNLGQYNAMDIRKHLPERL